MLVYRLVTMHLAAQDGHALRLHAERWEGGCEGGGREGKELGAIPCTCCNVRAACHTLLQLQARCSANSDANIMITHGCKLV